MIALYCNWIIILCYRFRMSAVLNVSPRDISYFHRDYANDVKPPKIEADNQSWVSLAQRAAFASLPFLSLQAF